MIEKSLKANKTKKVWFCGHSLGGAMATICAGRCFLSEIPSMPRGTVHLRLPARRHETIHQLLSHPTHPLGEQQRHRAAPPARVARLSSLGPGNVSQSQRPAAQS